MTEYRVAIAGLGAIGLKLAACIDADAIPGMRLTAISSRDRKKAAYAIANFRAPPAIVGLDDLPQQADIVVECIPAAAFRSVAEPAVRAGRLFMPLSVGALLDHMDLVDIARESGARILVPTGALLGLDAVRAAAEGTIESVRIVTRKPPKGLKGAPLLEARGLSVDGLSEPLLVFEGSTREAIKGFPANVNVAVALALAGIGPDATRIEIWADPAVTRNTHTITVVSDTANFEMTIAGLPTAENPATGRITALSAIAALRRLTAPLVIGS